jgi:hypothetical protein
MALFTSGQSSGVLMTGEEIIKREKLGFTRWQVFVLPYLASHSFSDNDFISVNFCRVNMYLRPRQVTVNDL